MRSLVVMTKDVGAEATHPLRDRAAEDRFGKVQMKLCEHVRFAIQPEGGVLLDSSTGEMFAVNDVGVMILNALQNGATHQECVTNLKRAFVEVSADALDADIAEFVKELMQRGLVRRQGKV